MILNSAYYSEPHEYLRDSLDSNYRERNSCKNRTEFRCIKCGFCWSCHWKVEQMDKINFFDRQLVREIAKSDPLSLSHSMVINQAGEKYKQHMLEQTDHYPLMAKAVDVFGKEVEPICDYLRCHHKLSVHGLSSGKCRCKHPQNATIGA
jgi:hypothetical protein